MECTGCGSRKTKVTDSRKSWNSAGYEIPEGMVGRLRKCNDCGHEFYTWELSRPVKLFESSFCKPLIKG